MESMWLLWEKSMLLFCEVLCSVVQEMHWQFCSYTSTVLWVIGFPCHWEPNSVSEITADAYSVMFD